ncbi:unnamed protein product [Leuciscus chuanchicus]
MEVPEVWTLVPVCALPLRKKMGMRLAPAGANTSAASPSPGCLSQERFGAFLVSWRRSGGATFLRWDLWDLATVIIVHGLFDTSADFINLHRFINLSHPGTNVTVLDLFDRSASLQPLWKQVEGFAEAIYPIMQNAADGIHLICYSQDTDYLKYLFPQFVKSNLYHVCYTAVGQKISICNYWNDPHHRDLYINSSDYLALLNNERTNPNSTAWKLNFLRIKKLVLIGGPDDGVITPWQSSQFGFYDDNETVVEMKNQKVFLMDLFGLKTLYARGDLALCSMADVAHVFWHSNETVYKTCIEKWLT